MISLIIDEFLHAIDFYGNIIVMRKILYWHLTELMFRSDLEFLLMFWSHWLTIKQLLFLGVDIQGSPRSFLVVFPSHKLLASAQLLVVKSYLELHLSLRIFSGLEPHSHFWHFFCPSGKTFSEWQGMLFLTMTQFWKMFLEVFCHWHVSPPGFTVLRIQS